MQFATAGRWLLFRDVVALLGLAWLALTNSPSYRACTVRLTPARASCCWRGTEGASTALPWLRSMARTVSSPKRCRTALEKLEPTDIYGAAWLLADCGAELATDDPAIWALVDRFATWDRAPFAGGDYHVSVHAARP